MAAAKPGHRDDGRRPLPSSRCYFAPGGLGAGAFPLRSVCSRSALGEPVCEVWLGWVCCRLPLSLGLPGVADLSDTSDCEPLCLFEDVTLLSSCQ
jgi:hypothetical protein